MILMFEVINYYVMSYICWDIIYELSWLNSLTSVFGFGLSGGLFIFNSMVKLGSCFWTQHYCFLSICIDFHLLSRVMTIYHEWYIMGWTYIVDFSYKCNFKIRVLFYEVRKLVLWNDSSSIFTWNAVCESVLWCFLCCFYTFCLYMSMQSLKKLEDSRKKVSIHIFFWK